MALGAAVPFARSSKSTVAVVPLTKAIPKTGERLPVIGMGSWKTFNVGDDSSARDVRVQVIKTFLKLAGA